MAVQVPPASPRPARGAAPLFGAYLAFGAYWGVWAVVFADFLAERVLSDGAAGLYLAALSTTSILTMTLVAPRLGRLPLTRSIPLGLVCMGVGAVLVALGPGAWLAVGFAAIGVGNGLIDVFVNVGGQAVEAGRGRPVLQYLHASYNVGGIAGALAAGFAHAAGVDHRVPVVATAAVFAAAAAWCAAAQGLPERSAGAGTGSRFSLSVFARSPALIVPAIVVLSGFMVEGSMDIWSVIYLRETLGASAVAGGIAFAVFSLAMAVGRVAAARLLFGLGYRATLRVAGLGSFAAGLVAALTQSAVVAGTAFVFLGFFIASAAPAAFGLVSETDEDPALAIAGMTTVGYSGFVIGPPIMGWLAGSVGLRATMLVLVTMALGVVVGGIVGPRRARPREAVALDQPRLR